MPFSSAEMLASPKYGTGLLSARKKANFSCSVPMRNFSFGLLARRKIIGQLLNRREWGLVGGIASHSSLPALGERLEKPGQLEG